MRPLYPRATVVIHNHANDVLLIKYGHSRDWELPGRRLNADADPIHILVSTISQRLGLNITQLEFQGVHSGNQWFHCVFTARADGTPKPTLADIREAIWWDVQTPLECQPHVPACLAIANYTHHLSKNNPESWEPRGRSLGAFLKGVLKQMTGID